MIEIKPQHRWLLAVEYFYLHSSKHLVRPPGLFTGISSILKMDLTQASQDWNARLNYLVESDVRYAKQGDRQ